MSTSTDRKVTTDLIETLEDGSRGFAEAAERLAGTDRPDLATRFAEFGRQRAAFSQELESMAAAYGDDIDENGSVAAAVHRGWMSIKDAVTGSSASGVSTWRAAARNMP
ncbi:MAG: PA2169 family four-helix-bundle protein [Acidimicrobiales bacterium]